MNKISQIYIKKKKIFVGCSIEPTDIERDKQHYESAVYIQVDYNKYTDWSVVLPLYSCTHNSYSGRGGGKLCWVKTNQNNE